MVSWGLYAVQSRLGSVLTVTADVLLSVQPLEASQMWTTPRGLATLELNAQLGVPVPRIQHP